jgi:uncharacterized membrane protein YbhN (UPF0104 family)
MDDKQRISLFIRLLTLTAAEIVFVALVFDFVTQTWQAKVGVPPVLPSVQVNALAGLAVLLGGGYGVVLGKPGGDADGLLTSLWNIRGERALLFAGVIVYMLAGFAICFTYGVREAETPSVLKTIAIAFVGYVVAYISTAYQQLNQR